MSKQLGKHEEWFMPEWLEDYRELIEAGCGGSSAETLMNNHTATFFNNAILCELIGMCQTKIILLENLRTLGVLPFRPKGSRVLSMKGVSKT